VGVEHYLKAGIIGILWIQKSYLCRNASSGDSLRCAGCCRAEGFTAHEYNSQSERYQKKL
jgi:hypothetical protein